MRWKWRMNICPLNFASSTRISARAVAKKIPDVLVLGADTLVFLDGEILANRAILLMRDDAEKLQGRTHQVVTGVSLMHLRSYRERIFAVSTDVLFRSFADETITDYLAKGTRSTLLG